MAAEMVATPAAEVVEAVDRPPGDAGDAGDAVAESSANLAAEVVVVAAVPDRSSSRPGSNTPARGVRSLSARTARR
jgi:hypothetical protein